MGWIAQQERNRKLISDSTYMRESVTSEVVPQYIDIAQTAELSSAQVLGQQALEIEAARIAIKSLASLSKINELDHLGGGLDLIPALTLTLSMMDYKKREFTIENAHTSIGYYSALAARGFLDPEIVIEQFRRGLDIAGHVSWVPGGTQLNGGRLGVMVPVAVGQALGKKAKHGEGSWVVCHCGDAGWISGQALNGFNGADVHGAPITFVMHRNGIQLSGSTRSILDKDPRKMIAAMGVEIIETPLLTNVEGLYGAYREAYQLAQNGRPSLIYPTGCGSFDDRKATLYDVGENCGIPKEVEAFAKKNNVPMETNVWIPGVLMSYRDVESMLECLFLVNELPGGAGHHDGHMKGRDLDEVLSNPMVTFSAEQEKALSELRKATPHKVTTTARPQPGSPNLMLSDADVADVKLPEAGAKTSARAGVSVGYEAVAKKYPEDVFVISCDLDASTKLGAARKHIADNHQFEMSIEEQVSTLMANGLAMAGSDKGLNVFSTFSAFFEGIAREGMELWRYQRNLNGVNEGLNACMHLSHVGACTGRDHFSGWSLDWITLALGYLPYLHRFYAPCDARSAFVAIRDLAGHYGGHIIGIPRDNLPVLKKQNSDEPLWAATDKWEAITPFRKYDGAKKAILAFGAPAYLADEAAEKLSAAGTPVDVYIVNGCPLPEGSLEKILATYTEGVITIEDGIIATPETGGLRGFAGLVATAAVNRDLKTNHVGITDPRIAPAEGHDEVWEHFGITVERLVETCS